ncbi:MAG: bifunctional diaminohydroxyphosphoribosylaminopyrimidine deaminase/5-amino-6-(5-phosphoribosylamino)uracil reductase RibD [Rubrivivax sp.]|nr:bifunctional diaminohydroxyphosphoribosylaminopyrimidine deaminase/5-amino-6-(5-phosphoribosylamino)uracil reductase RibD [Rubrivivax sp.]
MNIDAADRVRMTRALALAAESIGLSDPNPRVGCVIAAANGTMAAEGFTQHAGGPHAEAVALAQAASARVDLRGGTAWVTLEPCAHQGRTPPCCDALVAAGLARVVVATGDPFPRVAGVGMHRLRAAGIVVDKIAADDELALAAREINVGFFSRLERGRPWVRLKVAMSLDGRTALENGVSQWITGEQARIDTHRWRKRASAILTGIGTALHDRPRLDVRHVPTAVQPLRVVADSRCRTPLDAPILAGPGTCLIATACGSKKHIQALRSAHADVVECGATDGRVDLNALLGLLAAREANEVHVEAGSALNGALLAGGLVDELLVYLAPRLLGPGRNVAELRRIDTLSDGLNFAWTECKSVGDDLRLRAFLPQTPKRAL